MWVLVSHERNEEACLVLCGTVCSTTVTCSMELQVTIEHNPAINNPHWFTFLAAETLKLGQSTAGWVESTGINWNHVFFFYHLFVKMSQLTDSHWSHFIFQAQLTCSILHNLKMYKTAAGLVCEIDPSVKLIDLSNWLICQTDWSVHVNVTCQCHMSRNKEAAQTGNSKIALKTMSVWKQ